MSPASPDPTPPSHQLLLSEVLSALSYALDLTEGQPLGHSARSCLIGMRIGTELGLDAEQLSALFYALLLKDAGLFQQRGQGLRALRGRRLHAQARSLRR